ASERRRIGAGLAPLHLRATRGQQHDAERSRVRDGFHAVRLPVFRTRRAENSMTISTLPADGLVAFVKRECPTCALIEGEMREVAAAVAAFHVASQDDPGFPAGLPRVIDDRELDHSWLNRIEATPTLLRFEKGREVERVEGWDREGWRRLTGLADL